MVARDRLWSRANPFNDPAGEHNMTDPLEALIEKARKVQMTDSQLREQRLSFVYGNTHIENDRITREMVAEADEKVAQEEAERQRQAK
jgi:hypothetical protein